MNTVVKGVYKNGQIALSETPPDIDEAPVLVTFLVPNGSKGAAAASQPQYIQFGQFPELGHFTEEDFRRAEWHGDPDDELSTPGDDL